MPKIVNAPRSYKLMGVTTHIVHVADKRRDTVPVRVRILYLGPVRIEC